MNCVGIIKPPPDIRAVVHKTAQFVAKNGRAFETKILAREEGKSMKFSFLEASSPFHAYYEDRVLFFQRGDDAAAEEKKYGNQTTKVMIDIICIILLIN